MRAHLWPRDLKVCRNPREGRGASFLGGLGPPPIKLLHKLLNPPGASMAQPSLPSNVTCSAQCQLLSEAFPDPCCPLPSVSPAAHFRSLHVAHHCLALLSPQREHQLIPVPETVWQVAGTQQIVGCKSDGPSLSFPIWEREAPSLWSSGSLPRPSPTRSVCLRARRTRKTGNSGDGHRSEQGAHRGDSQVPPTGLGGSFISRLVSKLASRC